MKQIFVLITGLFILVSAAFGIKPSHVTPLKASEIKIFISKDKSISLMELATMNRSEFEKIRGKKLNLFERMHLKVAQNKLRNDINSNGELVGKKYEKLAGPDDGMNGTTGFHLGGAALGFFLSIIGVLIAYLLKDGPRKNRIKWAWIGFAVGLVFGLGFGFIL